MYDDFVDLAKHSISFRRSCGWMKSLWHPSFEQIFCIIPQPSLCESRSRLPRVSKSRFSTSLVTKKNRLIKAANLVHANQTGRNFWSFQSKIAILNLEESIWKWTWKNPCRAGEKDDYTRSHLSFLWNWNLKINLSTIWIPPFHIGSFSYVSLTKPDASQIPFVDWLFY